MKILILTLAVLIPIKAQAFTEKDAVNTIIGEASNQGLIGMICVGEVIRNRGSLKGFYGFHSSHIKYESDFIVCEAIEAWIASSYTKFTKGADHFENIHAFGKPYWVKFCVKTYQYRDHVFYREKH